MYSISNFRCKEVLDHSHCIWVVKGFYTVSLWEQALGYTVITSRWIITMVTTGGTQTFNLHGSSGVLKTSSFKCLCIDYGIIMVFSEFCNSTWSISSTFWQNDATYTCDLDVFLIKNGLFLVIRIISSRSFHRLVHSCCFYNSLYLHHIAILCCLMICGLSKDIRSSMTILFSLLEITGAKIRPQVKWAVNLQMATSIFLWGLCGYVWVNIHTLSPLMVTSHG